MWIKEKQSATYINLDKARMIVVLSNRTEITFVNGDVVSCGPEFEMVGIDNNPKNISEVIKYVDPQGVKRMAFEPVFTKIGEGDGK